MKSYVKIARMIALFGQLGFTIVTPPVVLALGAYALQRRFSLGSWIMLLAIFLGLLASASGAYQFYKQVICLDNKHKKRSETVVFYRHE